MIMFRRGKEVILPFRIEEDVVVGWGDAHNIQMVGQGNKKKKRKKKKTKMKQVTLPKLFEYHRSDFGRNDKEMLTWISRYLAPAKKKELLGLIDVGPYYVVDWKPSLKPYLSGD